MRPLSIRLFSILGYLFLFGICTSASSQPIPEISRGRIYPIACYEVAATFGSQYQPMSSNTSGMVVGTFVSPPTFRAFRSFQGIAEFLFAPGEVSTAKDINYYGDVVGDVGYTDGFLLHGSTLTRVTVPNVAVTRLSALNRYRAAVGTVKLSDSGEDCGFTDRPLLFTSGATQVIVNHMGCGIDINTAGTMVARFSPTSYLGQAFLVSSSGEYLSELGPNGDPEFPAAINDSNKVVGVEGVGLIAHAVRWEGSQTHTLPIPTFPNSRVQSAALDINNSGTIVGTANIFHFEGGFDRTTALVWSQTGVNELSNLMCPEYNLNNFTKALHVDDTGKILAEYQNGQVYYLLRPRTYRRLP